LLPTRAPWTARDRCYRFRSCPVCIAFARRSLPARWGGPRRHALRFGGFRAESKSPRPARMRQQSSPIKALRPRMEPNPRTQRQSMHTRKLTRRSRPTRPTLPGPTASPAWIRPPTAASILPPTPQPTRPRMPTLPPTRTLHLPTRAWTDAATRPPASKAVALALLRSHPDGPVPTRSMKVWAVRRHRRLRVAPAPIPTSSITETGHPAHLPRIARATAGRQPARRAEPLSRIITRTPVARRNADRSISRLGRHAPTWIRVRGDDSLSQRPSRPGERARRMRAARSRPRVGPATFACAPPQARPPRQDVMPAKCALPPRSSHLKLQRTVSPTADRYLAHPGTRPVEPTINPQPTRALVRRAHVEPRRA
jgi:hypothetical protein